MVEFWRGAQVVVKETRLSGVRVAQVGQSDAGKVP